MSHTTFWKREHALRQAKQALGPYQDFWESLMSMWTTHTQKNHDYAGDHETYFNFTYAAMVAEPFKDPVDKVFATMVGIKLARLAVLKGTGRKPKNEPVVDSHKDLATYSTIWWTFEKERVKHEHGRRLRAGIRKRQRAAGGSRRSTSKARTSKPKTSRRTNR